MGCAASLHPDPVSPVAVRHSEYLTIEGARTYLMLRGADRRAPVLLWLHGGPGGAERPLFRYFNGELEDHFVVAYWDQRGAGRSFDSEADPKRLTIARHIADLDVVVDHLKRHFSQEKIVLIGHSWGAVLGILYSKMYPDKVSAMIGVNPVISTRQSQQAEYDFIHSEAMRSQDDTILARLREIGTPPYRTSTQVLEIERITERYGGVFHNKPNYAGVMIKAVFSGLVTPWEIPGFIRGNNVSLEAMHEELLALDLKRSFPRLDVPVFFFLGRYDRHVDATVAADYFETLQARNKKLVWFEKSAHNIPFEEPDCFNATVLNLLKSIGIKHMATSN